MGGSLCRLERLLAGGRQAFDFVYVAPFVVQFGFHERFWGSNEPKQVVAGGLQSWCVRWCVKRRECAGEAVSSFTSAGS